MANERPCKYCGFVASRLSDEDCPAKPGGSMAKKVDVVRSLATVKWKSKLIENEIWTGRSIGEWSPAQDRRITYINSLSRQISQSIEDLLTEFRNDKKEKKNA